MNPKVIVVNNLIVLPDIGRLILVKINNFILFVFCDKINISLKNGGENSKGDQNEPHWSWKA